MSTVAASHLPGPELMDADGVFVRKKLLHLQIFFVSSIRVKRDQNSGIPSPLHLRYCVLASLWLTPFIQLFCLKMEYFVEQEKVKAGHAAEANENPSTEKAKPKQVGGVVFTGGK